jgi:adenosylmethionine-8-amino-7-oxononanoate aminotransferase
MLTMPAGFLAEAARLARAHGVLLLCDEVATGFGRTGRLYAVEHESVGPDLMTVGKGLTGGYLPVAATFASDEIYDAFLADGAEKRQFFHGHSYTGNQLGCAVALANLDLYERERVVERAARAGELLGRLLDEHVAALEHVGEVRRCGTLVGIELVADRATAEPFDPRLGLGRRACLRARELGLLTRPLGDVVTLVPPLATEDADLEAMVSILGRAIAEVGALVPAAVA